MLEHKEWIRINDIIYIINSIEDADEMRSHFLEAIKMLIPYEKAMFYHVLEEGGIPHIVKPIFANVSSDFANAYEKSVLQCEYGRVALNLHKTFAYRDTDLMSDEIRLSTDVYKSFLKPYDVPYGGGIILANKGMLISEITFFKTQEQGDFTDRDVYIWDIIKDHLELRMIRENAAMNDKLKHKYSKLEEYGLTKREIEVALLIVNNYRTAEVSEKLSISIFTTKKHLNNIFTKLNITSRMQLLQLFWKL